MAEAGYWKMRRLWGQGWEDKISLTINNNYYIFREGFSYITAMLWNSLPT